MKSARTNDNWWICKECGKAKNFGYDFSGYIALENIPVNFDGNYDDVIFEAES